MNIRSVSGDSSQVNPRAATTAGPRVSPRGVPRASSATRVEGRALALYAVMFVYVGLATTLYTLGLAMIGDRFTGGAIAAANAAFVMAYGIGSFAGPPVAGAAMDMIDPQGVLIVLSGFALLFIAVLTIRIVQRRTG